MKLSLGRKIRLSLIFVGLLLGAAEVGARLLDMPKGASFWDPIPAKEGQLIYTPHPFLGTTVRPEQQMRMRDGVGRVEVNENGLRGEAVSVSAPEGTSRVVVHGGSAVFGTGADDADTFSVRMQRALEEDTGRSWQVINAGIPGFTSLQSLILFGSKTSDYRADYAILYQAYNDIKMIGPDFRSDYTHMVRVVGDRGLVHNIFRRSKLYNTARRSEALGKFFSKTPLATVVQLTGTAGGATGDARSTFRRNVTHFVQMAEGAGSRPVLSTFAMPLSAAVLARYPDLEKNIVNFSGYTPAQIRPLLDDYNGIIREVAEERELPLLDGEAVLADDGANFIDHCHLSPQGAEKLGRAFARLIEEDQARRAPPSGG